MDKFEDEMNNNSSSSLPLSSSLPEKSRTSFLSSAGGRVLKSISPRLARKVMKNEMRLETKKMMKKKKNRNRLDFEGGGGQKARAKSASPMARIKKKKDVREDLLNRFLPLTSL